MVTYRISCSSDGIVRTCNGLGLLSSMGWSLLDMDCLCIGWLIGGGVVGVDIVCMLLGIRSMSCSLYRRDCMYLGY